VGRTFRNVVLVVVVVALLGAGGWWLHMRSDAETQLDMKRFCGAVEIAVLYTGNPSEETIWQGLMKNDAQAVGGQVESDEQLLEQAVYENFEAGFQVDFQNLRRDCTNAGYST
jgi:hypothetical protein